MEVYVIKRDDGEYFYRPQYDYNFNYIARYTCKLNSAKKFSTQKSAENELGRLINNENLKLCLLTIFEGTLEQHDAEVKKQERERVLDLVREKYRASNIISGDDNNLVFLDNLDKIEEDTNND